MASHTDIGDERLLPTGELNAGATTGTNLPVQQAGLQERVEGVTEPQSEPSVLPTESSSAPAETTTQRKSTTSGASTPIHAQDMQQQFDLLRADFSVKIENMTKVVTNLQGQILSLESDKEALQKENRAQIRKVVELNRDRVEEMELAMKANDDIREQVDKLKERKPEFGGKSKEDIYAHFVTKFAQHFPSFDVKQSEMRLRYWEEYWDSITGFQRMTSCQDVIIAYLIKDSAPPGSELDTCLKDVTHTGEDGYVDIHELGLDGIKARMLEDFGPKPYVMANQAREKFFSTRRKFKERPKWYFRRLRMNKFQMNKADPDFQISDSFFAQMIFYNSGLERKEREKLFQEAEGVWKADLFESLILKRYENKHELDCAMVDRAFKNKSRDGAHRTYICDDPENGICGTDLFRG